ncbi:MAG: PBP1A family penicillin-binding protein [Oscillospiraceae bacterium]|nr:PBP1A family penicillin-binding protein [Oscillospiraceae bacterium]
MLHNRKENPEEEAVPSSSHQAAKLAGRFALSAFSYTIDGAAGIVRGVFKVLCSLLLIFVLTGLLFTVVFAYYVKTSLTPTLDLSLNDYRLSESSTVWYEDSSGEWRRLANLSGKEDRVWVDYDDVPEYMEQALVAIEDKRFYDHKGVDWYRTSGAFVKMFATMQNSFGGSTITQQLIKNLTGNDDVTVQRKLAEIFSALELEKKYSKQEIIEWYLNAVYFGEGCWGVQTAAETYFGKDVKDLSLAECAAIVGITNKPTAYNPFYDQSANKDRQETILREMYEQGYIDYRTYTDAVNEELVFTRSANDVAVQEINSYYVETVVEDVIRDLISTKNISRETAAHLVYSGGYQIYSCIKPDIQAAVDAVYTNLSAIPATTRSTQQLQSAIVVMNPYNGKIIALSGGVGEKNANLLLNRATQTKRPTGSSIKPLASYGPAIELGLITPNTLVDDSPDIRLAGTSWYPYNASGYNSGVVDINTALCQSINTVAAQIIDKLGPETSYNWLGNRLGFTSLVPDDCAYAPLALGQFTYGITVREMAQAYCSLVNDGIFTYGRTYTKVTDSKGNVVIDNTPQTIQAFSPNTAYNLTYMMKNAVAYGTGYEASLSSTPVAGKTGSTTDYCDRWFIGCTRYYVAAVWTGYDTPERIYCNGNPAAQLWKKVMQPVHEGLEWQDFSWPSIGGDTGIFGVQYTYSPYSGENADGTYG